ncbi:MAG TPA: LON peptidase substrate-binding domain-containing protein [Thermoanaerobaculia bacterium]|nr:LON peptidase substrate-binding domain-containing protein [Thermoanaerobaculia bacterium]
MTRRRIPLFPLPEVVLLPGTQLPLHIFEPRYRAMVADALAGDQTIGMAMMKPGWEHAGATPAILPVGGAGRIVDSEELADGRYNIVLEGEFRYRVLSEAPPDPYRIANVEEVPSVPFSHESDAVRICGAAVSLFREVSQAMSLAPLPEDALSPEHLGSEIALRLRYEPAELQALLETDSIPARFEALMARMRDWQTRIHLLSPFRRREMDPSRN